MKKLKIALLAGISTIHTSRWANALAERGHELHLITEHRGGDVLSAKVNVHYLPFQGSMGYFFNAPFLRNYLKKLGPDLLHAHYASGYGTLGRLSGFHPYILSVWGSDVYDFPCQSRFKMRLLQKNLQAADLVASTSNVMAKQTRMLCPGLLEIRITPFGIDTNFFKPGNATGREGTITIGTVKTMAFKYGIDTFIKGFALARFSLAQRDEKLASRLRLLIVGGGEDRDSLQKLAHSLGVAGVTEFTGPVSHAAVPEYLNRLDVYVAVSRLDSESFGVAVLEASACALPVIVSDAGGLPEVVEDGVTGTIVRRDDPQALAEAIVELVLDTNLRRRMGEAGLRRVNDHYTWEASITLMENLYNEIVS